MKNADKQITLFHFYGSSDDPNIFLSKRTHVNGASVFSQTKVTVDKDGLHSANVYTIRIPRDSVEEAFFRPVVFDSMEDKANAFTMAPDDKIVIGYANDENPTESELEKKYGFDNVVTITGITDNRDKREPHWKVIGE